MNSTRRAAPHWGWVIAGSCSFLIFAVAGSTFYGTSIFMVPLQNLFSSSRTAIAQAFAVVSLLTGLMAPVVGLFVDKYGAKRCLALGISALAVIYFFYSRMTALWHLYVLVVVQGLFQPFAGGLPNQALIGKWFVHRRGRAMGLAGAGIGFGGLIIPWTLAMIIENYNYQSAYLFTTVLLGGLCLPVVLFLVRDDPAKACKKPDVNVSEHTAQNEIHSDEGLTLHEAMRGYPFWGILLGSALVQTTIGLISLHLPAMLQDAGLSLSSSGAYLGIALGIGITGRLLVGELSDRVKPRYLFLVAAAGMGLSSLFMLYPGVVVARGAFVVTYGIFQGAAVTVTALVIHSLFGVRYFGRIYGVIVLASAGSVALGNYIGGLTYDLRGNYTPAVFLACAAGLCAAVLLLCIRTTNEIRFWWKGKENF